MFKKNHTHLKRVVIWDILASFKIVYNNNGTFVESFKYKTVISMRLDLNGFTSLEVL